MDYSILVTSLVVGLLGGIHCLGMCGGVVGALTFGVDVKIQTSRFRMMLFQVAYNTGRISSYIIIGAIFGYIGMALGSLATFLPAQQLLQVIAGLFMIALGLYLAGWWYGIVAIEKAGQGLWKHVQPYANKLTPIKHLPQAWLYGLVWGWLPCGLVYSMLIMAMSAGGAFEGAMVMLAFGLGTLPNLLLMGAFAFYFTRLSRKEWIRKGAGLGVIGMGLWQLYLAWAIEVA